MTMRSQKVGSPTPKSPSGNRRLAQPLIPTVLIEPNLLFREGLNHILERTRFRVVLRADTVADLRIPAQANKAPALFLMHTDHSVDAAISDIARLKSTYADCRVVCSERSYRPEDVIELLRAGADGVLLRTISADTFVKSLELVMLGERVIPAAAMSLGALQSEAAPAPPEPAQPEPEQAAQSPQTHKGYHLSERELAILRCLLLGEANKIIALKLDIAEATVKVHVKAILRKIRVQNRTQAAIWALSNLVDLEPKRPAVPSRHSANCTVEPRRVECANGAGVHLHVS